MVVGVAYSNVFLLKQWLLEQGIQWGRQDELMGTRVSTF